MTVNEITNQKAGPMLIVQKGSEQMQVMKTGIVLLVIAGAFYIGQWQGGLQRETKNFKFLKESSALMHERNVGIRASKDLHDYCGGTYPSAFSDLHDDVCWRSRPAIAAELRDCNDAMFMWMRALEQRAGNWDDNRALPGFRYLNPEGEIVTYHLPPPRKRTGPLHIGPDTVRREAGYMTPAEKENR